MYFILGFSLCLNIICLFIAIFLYKNYKKSSPITMHEELVKTLDDVVKNFDVKDINL